MKIAMPNRLIYILKIISILISFFVLLFSASNLFINYLPTLYTLVFGYALFFLLGVIYSTIYPLSSIEDIYLSPIKPYIYKLLNIVFVFIVFLIILILSKSLYIKPDIYYLLISIEIAILSYLIICGDKSKKLLILLQIIFISAILRGSSYLINTHFMGPDTTYHLDWIKRILESGHLSPMAAHYYFFPSYHLIQSISGILMGFSKLSVESSNLCISLIPIILAYLIGCEIYQNYKAGLFSALILSVQPIHIFLTTYNMGKIGGVTLLILCIFLLTKINSRDNARFHFILWISITTLFLWHPETSFPLLALLAGNVLLSYLIKQKIEIKALSLYIIIWLYYIFMVHVTLGTGILESIFIESPPSLVQSNANYANSAPNLIFLIQAFISYMGITLLVFLASYIGFRWLEKLDKIGLLMLFSLIFAHALPSIGIFFGRFGVGPDRTLVAVAVLLSIISSGAIVQIFLSSKKSIYIFTLLIFIFAGISTSSYLIGDGNNVFNDQIPRQTIFVTDSLFDSHIFLDKNVDKHSSVIQSDYHIINWKSINNLDYLVTNIPNLKRLKWEDSIIYPEIQKITYMSKNLYDNGDIHIYKI